MKRRRVTLQSLLGRVVLDCDGARVGRIHDVLAEPEGERCIVREWLLGEILSHRGEATLLEPAEMRDVVAARARELANELGVSRLRARA